MSLGWGLRGTIGGGPVGAMIPGAIVMLCLCHLLGWRRSLGTVVAIGTVGIGLGGQETYGQTIGFLRDAATVPWGLAGLTIKGAMWGLSGGVLVGLALMHEKYRPREIAVGLCLMMAGTALGRVLIDEPKLVYFSNRLDKPREEVWVGLTLGALALLTYLAWLRRERISAAFAWGGLAAGAAGFGGGSLFLALGFALAEPYRGWPWWKMMEFTFGALYGLGLGAVCYMLRGALRRQENETGTAEESYDFCHDLSAAAMIAAGLAVAIDGLWLNFTIPFRAMFTIVASLLVVASTTSNRLAWHVALTMTIAGFLRDFLRATLEWKWVEAPIDSWSNVALFALPVAAAVAVAETSRKLTSPLALLALIWSGTFFGLVKVGLPREGKGLHLFVPAVFVVELLATSALVAAVKPNGSRIGDDTPASSPTAGA
jgi:hypothetical protein